MRKISAFLYKFLYGRYGIDDLYKVSVIVYLILVVINIFVNSRILTTIELLIFMIIMYRSLSRNIVRRRWENEKYLKIKRGIVKKYNSIKKRIQVRNTHMYRKCPKCRKTLRLPLKKGEHTVKCPCCSKKFSVKCKRDEKIKVEVIKNKG